jgi:cell division protease FtsH
MREQYLLRDNRDSILEKDIEEAALKVTLGSERKTLQTEDERKMTAYHEAGHALVAQYVKDMDPVYRVSIVARGGSLGHTSFPPERDRYNETKTRLLSIIATSLGGRAAEEIVFNELTVGASDDIKRATTIAKKMVTEFGMSDLGPISYASVSGNMWIAKDFDEGTHVSSEMEAKIDTEVKKIMDESYAKAKEVILSKREMLNKISTRLLEKETIESDEFKELINS